MKNPKILILILSCGLDYCTYNKTFGIDKTWGPVKVPNTETYYYYGNSKNINHDSNAIYATSPESYNLIGPRTMEVFSYCLDNFKFDYIYRTNISSYVHKENLLKYIKGKPRDKFYSGVIGHYAGVEYCSGSGYFLSKDLVKRLVKTQSSLCLNLVDDVAVGKLLPDIEKIPAPRCNIESLSECNQLTREMFHVRCRALQRETDSILMCKVHTIFEKYNQ